MWKWFKNLSVLLGTIFVLLCIAYLPKMIEIFQDREILSKAQVEEMQSVQLNIQEKLPVIGKLALMKNVHEGNAIEISEQDASMSKEKVQSEVSKALQVYYDTGLITMFEEDIRNCTPLLVWDTDNSSSRIVWQWVASTKKKKFFEIGVLLDDETGEILLIQYTGNRILDDSRQKDILPIFCELYFEGLQIVDYGKFVIDDLEHEYIGENVQGIRYCFQDTVYGAVIVDFYVNRYGFYMEFPNL